MRKPEQRAIPSGEPHAATPATPGGAVARFAASPIALKRGLRRFIKKNLSNVHSPVVNFILSRAARLRRQLVLRQTIVVGITGSCGKTTTTLLAGKILGTGGDCYVKAGASTHHTAARTMLSLSSSTRFCVHEVGAYRQGGIARTVKILRPQIGVVTIIGDDHYREFRGREGVAREKAPLIEQLPVTGTAIFNIDCPYARAMASRTRAKVIMFGCSADADVRATDISAAWPDRLSLTVIHNDQAERVRTRLVGEFWVSSVLAAISCGLACGLDLKDCASAIEAVEPSIGRFSVHTRPGGPVYLFDHKLPYWTIESSLKFLRGARARRKTIIFGTISDVPGSSGQRYRRVAREALEVADRVIFVGPNSGRIDRMLTEALYDRLLGFPTVYQTSNYLAEKTLPEELILIKGSIIADHLERIFLSQLDQVVCWRERCGRSKPCPDCSAYRKPSPPPVAETDRAIPGGSITDPRPIMFGRRS